MNPSSSSAVAPSLDVHQRLENIRLILNTFKIEQEQYILKFNDEYKFRLNRPSTLMTSTQSNTNQYQFQHGQKPSFLQPPGSNITANTDIPAEIQSSDTALLISKLINVDCIVMPSGSDNYSTQRLWPQALIAQYRDNMAKISNIESHGSLWKLLPRKDNMPGQRVIFQSAVSELYFCRLSPPPQLTHLSLFYQCLIIGNRRRTKVSECSIRTG